jgi:hypothetical protein
MRRTVLHHKGHRQRYRPRPLDGAGFYRAIRWCHADQERPGKGSASKRISASSASQLLWSAPQRSRNRFCLRPAAAARSEGSSVPIERIGQSATPDLKSHRIGAVRCHFGVKRKRIIDRRVGGDDSGLGRDVAAVAFDEDRPILLADPANDAAGVTPSWKRANDSRSHTRKARRSTTCSLGLKTAQGLTFTESFYWDMNEQTRTWSKRFRNDGQLLSAGIYKSFRQSFRGTGSP